MGRTQLSASDPGSVGQLQPDSGQSWSIYGWLGNSLVSYGAETSPCGLLGILTEWPPWGSQAALVAEGFKNENPREESKR